MTYLYPTYETYHVTSLNNSGVGTFRDAIESASGFPRFVLFDVGGYINLQTSVYLSKPNIYILGESAPSAITIRAGLDVENKPTLLQIGRTNPFVAPHDVIVRNLRLRIGDDSDENGSAIFVWGGHDIVVDHCSFEWCNDNLVTLWLASGDASIYNITIQRCIFAEPFAGHPTALAIHGDFDFGEIPDDTYKSVYNISVHHNLFAGFSHRSPLSRSGGVEFVNNVIYNFDYYTFQPSADDISDFVGNFIKCGPQSPLNTRTGWFYQYYDNGCSVPASIYLIGNHIDGLEDGDNWLNMCKWIDESTNEALSDVHRRLTRMDQPANPVTVQSAADVYEDVLTDCGATPRDSLDSRIVAEVRAGTGISSYRVSVAEAGGW